MTTAPPISNSGAAVAINKLQSAEPADFDRVSLAPQVPAHQAAIDLHRIYVANGDKMALRASTKAKEAIVR